ncbi:MAG: T9SS type A sorting domain-containing protein, partial [Muribaculaceae bacterium]|nr:T9SS type A sorting domain-containing protein [Muribaculaceae bacterium]
TYPAFDQSESNDSITISSDGGAINKTREGNTVTLTAPMLAGGNPQGWEYVWRNAQNEIGEGESIETVAAMSAGTLMAVEKAPYYLEMTNYGPNGDLWGQFNLESSLAVYRRPLTPAELLRKGNGSTHTLVIMAGISDSEVAKRGYEFVYGYTDADGRDHEIGCTPLRYFQIDRKVFDDPSCEKWCYALWRYADGSTVSSGRRYLNGTADEDFDASNFGNSRRPDADDFKTGSIVIKQLGGAVRITVDAESDTHMELVSLSGVKVMQRDVEGYTFGTINIDADDVAPGIYLLYVANKQEQTVKKIAIK